MKSAIVHYWFTAQRGGEAVVDAIADLLPNAEVFAHVIDPSQLSKTIAPRQQTQTFIGKLPFAKTRYQTYLPLMPLALEALDMQRFDLIVSSEAGPAKWIIPNPSARHICYCHSPMRYIWDQQHVYMKGLPAPMRLLADMYASHLRKSDVISSHRVDTFVANSSFTAERINKFYRRDATIIHPPVQVEAFSPSDQIGDYYLMCGEIRSYKRVDLAIQACSRLGRKLVIAGAGTIPKALREIGGKYLDVRGPVSFATLKTLLAQCKALLYPGIEDFGIVPVEAMASGRPVIAFNAGGARDTILHEQTGLLFNDQTVEGLMNAIGEFEQSGLENWSGPNCKKRATLFSSVEFARRFLDVLGK